MDNICNVNILKEFSASKNRFKSNLGLEVRKAVQKKEHTEQNSNENVLNIIFVMVL